MSRTLTVDLNADHPNSVAAEPTPFETDGSFRVELVNHGTASHVHVHLDDALSAVADLGEGNRYVEAEATETVTVRVGGARRSSVGGVLEVVTGYGAERVEVPVTLSALERPRDVAVDETLGEVQRGGDPDPLDERLRPMAPAAIAVAGLCCTVLAVAFASDTVAVVVALLAVAFAVAAWYSLR